jgi:hypothetical protein
MPAKKQKAILTITEESTDSLHFRWEFDPPVDPDNDEPSLIGAIVSTVIDAIHNKNGAEVIKQ